VYNFEQASFGKFVERGDRNPGHFYSMECGAAQY